MTREMARARKATRGRKVRGREMKRQEGTEMMSIWKEAMQRQEQAKVEVSQLLTCFRALTRRADIDATAKAKPKRVIKQRQSLAEKQLGTTIFPIARVKRIIKADKELDNLSSEAVFIIAVTTVS
jgi:hypothetical protein